MWNTIKPKLPAVLTIVAIIAVTAILKTVAAKAPQYHDALEYVLAALGVMGTAAVKMLFGADAAKVDAAIGLPEDKAAAK